MIQLLQLLQYYPVPMSVSNIGDSPVFQGLDHFKKHLRIFWPQQPSLVRESDIFCTCVSKTSQSQVESPLEGVPWEVPLDRLLDWVGALEELLAGLLAIGPLGGVHVLVQQLPEVIRHVQDLKVSRHPEKVRGEYVPKNGSYFVFTYWKPDFSLPDMLPKYSGSLITSQINFFWHSRSL